MSEEQQSVYQRREFREHDKVGLARRAAAEERHRRVAEMILAGIPTADIARSLGVTYVTAKRDVEFCRKTWAKGRLEVAEYGDLAIARLQELYAVARERSLTGDRESMKIAISIIDRLSKIVGCDAPVKREVQHNVEFNQQFAAVHEVFLSFADQLPPEAKAQLAAALAELPALPPSSVEPDDDTWDADYELEDEDLAHDG